MYFLVIIKSSFHKTNMAWILNWIPLSRMQWRVKHVWLADWCHYWLNVSCVHRHFDATSSWLMDVCTVSHSVFMRCSHGVGKYVFHQWTKWCYHHWVNIFQQLHRSSLHSALVPDDFWAQTFHKVVYQRVWCVVGYLINCFARNLLLSLPLQEFWKLVSIWQR